jgi:predicted esterase
MILGLHGCGDTASTFAQWGLAPTDVQATQGYIAVSVGGKDGTCWNEGTDVQPALDELEEAFACFYVHRRKVMVAGYSSGGGMAYILGLKHAEKFAGILIEHSGMTDPNGLLAAPAWRINVAHIGAKRDGFYPPAKYQADWAALRAKGHLVVSEELDIGHDGRAQDWVRTLLPKATVWVKP